MVSLSPHLVETHRSVSAQGSRCSSVAWCTNSLARHDAARMVSRSPCCSIENSATGLPVSRMPSAITRVHSGSMPITTQAATLGFEPVPITVRKCRSRSSPNWRRP